MLLAADIGNTDITIGIFCGEDLEAKFRITTGIRRTSDEFGVLLQELLRSRNLERIRIDAVIISSVVPEVMYSFQNAVQKYFGQKAMIVGPGIRTGIKMVTGNAREIGTDRIVSAAAAYELYGGPLIVMEFDTASTFDYITEDGAFAAGITCPGIQICAKALWEGAARLPQIEIRKPESILARDTVSSMQAGLVYGHIGQTEYIIQKIKQETGIAQMKTVATGGMGKLITDATDSIQIYDGTLTLKGLRIIYEKNKNW